MFLHNKTVINRVARTRFTRSARERDLHNENTASPAEQARCMTADTKVLSRCAPSENEWEQTFDAIPDMVAIIDPDFRIRRVNRALCNRFNLTKEDALNTPCYTLFHGTDEPPPDCPHREMTRDMKEHDVIRFEQTLNGFYHYSVSPLLDAEKKLACCVHVIRDITLLKKSEEKQLAAVATLQSVIDSISDAIMLIGADHQVLLMNAAAKEMHNKTAHPTPLHCYRLFHHQDAPCSGADHPCPMSQVLISGKSTLVTHHHLTSDGKSVPVEITASPVRDSAGKIIGIIELCRDITSRVKEEDEKRNLQARLFQQQKEESISALAGGIAHDFNNTLTGVLGYSELLQMSLEGGSEPFRYLSKIVEGANHLADLTSQLLAYAKGGKYLPRRSDMNEIIRSSLELAHKGRAAEIEVKTDLAANLWPVLADTGQIRQLLVNLFNNSFEAMAGQQCGTLTITSKNISWIEDHEISPTRIASAGEYVQVNVSDTGPGIPQKIRDRIFEPFFSSKFIGRGLGLAAAQGIAENHGGHLFLADSGTVETLFTLLLPREAFSETVPCPDDSAAIVEKKILIVDDNHEILDITVELLRNSGYAVLACDNGRDALESVRTDKAIHLIILDVMMPLMSGIEVYTQILTLPTTAKVLLTSGYDRETALDDLDLRHGDDFISKPFHLTSLLNKIRDMTSG